MKEALRVFCKGTGQLLNRGMCSILFASGCPNCIAEDVRSVLEVVCPSFEAKYLGLPTPEGCMKKDRFQSLGERLGKRINTWWENDLSFGRKEVHIKAIAQAIPMYTMTVFHLQDGVCEDMEKMIKRCWWASKNGKTWTHWVAWQKLLRSKGSRGLGFRDVRLFSKALLARQAWRLIEFLDSLCARVLKAKYYPNGELLDTVFPHAMSPSWRAVTFGLELLKEGLIWRVGHGKKIKILRHSWIPCDLRLRVMGRHRPCHLKWVAQMLNDEGAWWDKKGRLIASYGPMMLKLSNKSNSRERRKRISRPVVMRKLVFLQFGVRTGWRCDWRNRSVTRKFRVYIHGAIGLCGIVFGSYRYQPRSAFSSRESFVPVSPQSLISGREP